MFPSVRLLLVATLASIAAIACGLGLFAAFRVNHEPLTRLAHAGPPLQLVFTHAVPAPVANTPAAPFGERFQAEAPPIGNAEMPDSVPGVALASAPAAPSAGAGAGAATPALAAPVAPPLTADRDQAALPADQSPSAAQASVDATAAPDNAAAAEALPPMTAAKAADRPARKAVRHRRVARRARQQPDAAAQPTYQWAPAAKSSQRSNVAAGR